MDEGVALSHAGTVFGLDSIALLRRGGQKFVYRATRARQPVILKLVLLEGASDPNALERCAREVRLLKSLDSPNIVKVLTDMETIGSPATAAIWLEEELDGDDFSSLAPSNWSWEEAEALLRGLGNGLADMHANGYIHRDLSASNVRRTSAGIWKVMDPGFAKHLNLTSITGMWQPGTMGFMSPEHLVSGGHITPASDVFCLGILGFLALVGSLPIETNTHPDVYRQSLRKQVPSVREFRPDLSPGEAGIIDGCLLQQPARRFLNGGEVLLAIQRLNESGDSA